MRNELGEGKEVIRWNAHVAVLRLVIPLFCFICLVATQQTHGQTDSTIEQPDWVRSLQPDAARIRYTLDGRFQPLGITIVTGNADDALAREGGLEEPIGVRVSRITSNSAATAAGLRAGDLILRLNNRPINSDVDLSAVLNSATVDDVQTLDVLRGRQQLQKRLLLQSTGAKQSPCPSYAHPSGEYRFSYLPGWKLDANVRREAVTQRTYHYLQSAKGEYRFHLFADSIAAADARQSLISFQQEAAQGFLGGYTGWVVLGDLPATFASGVVGRERLFTLYRFAFVAGGKRFEMDLYTPPYHDPARLPNVLEVVLGTMHSPGSTGQGTNQMATVQGEAATRPNATAPPPPLRSTNPSIAAAEQTQAPRFDQLESERLMLEQQLDAFEAGLGGTGNSLPPRNVPPLPTLPQSPTTTGFSRLDQLRTELERLDSQLAKQESDKPRLPPPPPLKSTQPSLTATPGSDPQTMTRIPDVATIAELRKQAMETWNPPVEFDERDFFAEDAKPPKSGWMKSEHDPTRVVKFFEPLRIKPGYVLRAYVFHENGNANGVVWALPQDAPFPAPDAVPVLEQHLFKAPKPWDAIDDFMDAIEGNGSSWSYLAASILRRELNEFGASWHGIQWGSHCILETDPWRQPNPNPQDDEAHCLPTTPARVWKWQADRPQDWRPQVTIEADKVTVTFYTYSGKYPEKIFRHTDVYRPGKYRARVSDHAIGEGTGGYMY